MANHICASPIQPYIHIPCERRAGCRLRSRHKRLWLAPKLEDLIGTWCGGSQKIKPCESCFAPPLAFSVCLPDAWLESPT
jgi:hypothetical protein